MWGGGDQGLFGEAGASSSLSRAVCGEGELVFFALLASPRAAQQPLCMAPRTFNCVRGGSGQASALSTSPSCKHPTPTALFQSPAHTPEQQGVGGLGCRFKNKSLAQTSPVWVTQASYLPCVATKRGSPTLSRILRYRISHSDTGLTIDSVALFNLPHFGSDLRVHRIMVRCISNGV